MRGGAQRQRVRDQVRSIGGGGNGGLKEKKGKGDGQEDRGQECKKGNSGQEVRGRHIHGDKRQSKDKTDSLFKRSPICN